MVKSKTLSKAKLEQRICQVSHVEGIGSLYERIVLSRLFKRLIKKYQVTSSLEYYANITKGWDNITLATLIDQVSIADSNFRRLQTLWPDSNTPVTFSNLRDAPKSDLVWNFAIIHHHPGIIKRMAQKSNRFVLIFTPNVLNWGWPLHAGFHILTRTECKHPESGNRWRRTLFGLKQYIQSNALHPLETGYVDMPIWPDFAFSKDEVFKAIGKKPTDSDQTTPNFVTLRARMHQHTQYIEEKPIAKFVAPIIAHHQYVFAQI